jgi:D-proline reductase (dithiol) PrdB
VGLLAREVEAAGVTTVGLALVREVAVAAHAPRLLFVHWPFGHALGEPGRVEQQRTVLRDMLSMARRAPRPGLVVDLPYRWRRESYSPITDWTSDGAAFAAALARALEAPPLAEQGGETGQKELKIPYGAERTRPERKNRHE